MNDVKLLSDELYHLDLYLDETKARLCQIESVSSYFMDLLDVFVEDVCFYAEGLDD